jgi:protein-disulfide isomerase
VLDRANTRLGPLGPAGRDQGPFRARGPQARLSKANLSDNRRASRAHHDRRHPLSSKQKNPPATRKERRAAERRDRFEIAREERRARTSTRGGGSTPSFMTTRNITIAAVLAGVVIVAVIAAGQLGGKVSGTLKDPGTAYPAALLDGASIGKADAPVTLEVYEDFQCPVCAQYSLSVEPILVSQYVQPGTLRIVHHDIAILGRGGVDDESKLAAAGATCANKQGLYWTYAHWVYNNQDGENAGGFRRDRLTAIAEAAGLDATAFTSCLDDAATVQAVADITTKAVGLGINSTPTMYIGDQQIVGLKSAQELGALIEAAAASPSPAASDSAASPSAAP